MMTGSKKLLEETLSRQSGWTLIEALAAIIIVGIGVTLFSKVQKMSSGDSSTNSQILLAGKMIEKRLEDTRIKISKDTAANWPPKDTTINGVSPNFIKLVSVVTTAYSPKDGAVVANVKRLDITASWTQPRKDSLKITTYVSKRF
jgi:type II secretory pathway pseudopilin PulG